MWGRLSLNGSNGSLAKNDSSQTIESKSGRPGSNRRRPAWEAGILPLNYSRLQGCDCNKITALQREFMRTSCRPVGLFQLFEIDVHALALVRFIFFLFPDVMKQRVGKCLEFGVP